MGVFVIKQSIIFHFSVFRIEFRQINLVGLAVDDVFKLKFVKQETRNVRRFVTL